MNNKFRGSPKRESLCPKFDTMQKTLNVSLRCTVSLLSTSYLSFCCQGTGNKTLKKRCFWLTNMFWCFSERYLFRCILNKTSKAVIHCIIKLQSIVLWILSWRDRIKIWKCNKSCYNSFLMHSYLWSKDLITYFDIK